MKKFVFSICLSLFIFIGFQTVSAQSGTCGTNVQYTIIGNTISFMKGNGSGNPVWSSGCTDVFKNDSSITKVEVNDKIWLPENSGFMFYDCIYVQEMNLSKMDCSNVTYMNSMFLDCSSLADLDVSGWNTSNVIYMNRMFYNCSSLTSLDVSAWDTSNVTRMDFMFANCSSLIHLDVSNWNTSNVTEMEEMFTDCSSLIRLDVSNWNTSNVTMMEAMFAGCSSLIRLDLSGWDTSTVWNMRSMFEDCSSLTNLDVSSWDTSKVTNMSTLFEDCSSLTNLDVSNWDTSNVTMMDFMFRNCSSLCSLDMSNWDTSNVIGLTYIFSYCSSLSTITLGENTLKKNIFTSLPIYSENWTYIRHARNASTQLPLGTSKSGQDLFEAYNAGTMAGTWTSFDLTPPSSFDIKLPGALVTIASEAFAGGTFGTVLIPDGVKTIRQKAFANCANLNWIDIPASVTNIADNAFEGSKGLVIYCPAGSEAAKFAARNDIYYIVK